MEKQSGDDRPVVRDEDTIPGVEEKNDPGETYEDEIQAEHEGKTGAEVKEEDAEPHGKANRWYTGEVDLRPPVRRAQANQRAKRFSP